jgi:peptidoglycan hydrolase-like protein with peptidoglycan-binding domain
VVTALLAARRTSRNFGSVVHTIQRFGGIPDVTPRGADARVQRLTDPSDFTSDLAGESLTPGVTGGQPTAGVGSLGSTLLTIGSRGIAVADLQTLLNAAGANPALIADGDFGPATRAAVMAFQSSHDLVPDGIVGSKTTSALVEEVQPGASAAFASSGGGGGGVAGEGPPLLSGTAPAESVNDCVYEPKERDDSHTERGPVEPRIEPPITPVDTGEVVQTFLFSNFGSGDTNLKFTDHLASIRPIIDAFHLDSATPSHKVLRFEGYSDCVDSFKLNVALRRGRASATKEEFRKIGGLPDNLGDAVAGPFHTEPDPRGTLEEPVGQDRHRTAGSSEGRQSAGTERMSLQRSLRVPVRPVGDREHQRTSGCLWPRLGRERVHPA